MLVLRNHMVSLASSTGKFQAARRIMSGMVRIGMREVESFLAI